MTKQDILTVLNLIDSADMDDSERTRLAAAFLLMAAWYTAYEAGKAGVDTR